jgi:hypothetical protein
VKLANAEPVTVLELVEEFTVPGRVVDITHVVAELQFPVLADVTVAASIDLLKNRVNRMIIRFLVDLIILVFIFYEF